MKHVAPYLLSFLVVMTMLPGCSSRLNTANTRWWRAFNTRYNVYYNGSVAYIDASLERENGNKDNFTELIPLYTVGNKENRELGKANFDRAIEKCEKAIKLYSIRRRPVWDKNRRKTAEDIEWLNRKEYNPFMWKVWMLMGRSQFHEGNFEEAVSTFSYMSRLYATQPAIYHRAQAWLAKSYIEAGWQYEAENVIRNMRRDSIYWSAQKEWDYTYADYYIHTGDYQQAIPYLQKVIGHEMRRKQKAREWFLLGQLLAETGRNAEAYKAYKHVTKLNPHYALAFNARVAMTEVMAGGKQKQMIAKLKRMASSDNNKEYLDQVYYAIGNIYLSQRDTLRAIGAYEQGNERATRNGIEKGVLLLKLGDLYWQRNRFSDAKRCYDVAIGLLDKDRKDYRRLSERQQVLEALVPYTDAVELQDSLQRLARMSEKERNAAIDRVIVALKKKEKKEQNDRLSLAKGSDTPVQSGGASFPNAGLQPGKNGQQSTWYFYNPMVVARGKETFLRLWGRRDNIDNWQRINKTVLLTATDKAQEQPDSLSKAEELTDNDLRRPDSASVYRREYYLKQIPLTAEQLKESNKQLADGLFHSGIIFKDRLDNLALSEQALLRLVRDFPDYAQRDEAYYHLYLLYARKNEPEQAETYIHRLKKEYPDSKWTALLTDPYYRENARWGEHIEDSLYTASYDAFKNERYQEVLGNAQVSAKRFPNGANRDKFLFIGGLSKLNDGDAKACLQDLNTLVATYPESRLSEMAGMIVNGIKAGRRLQRGRFDMATIWSRRSEVLNDSDSIQAVKLSPERNVGFVYMLVYHPDSVNENRLLFELAKYNFTSYLVRNFDIRIEDAEGMHRMSIKGFLNYDEALQYARSLHQQHGLVGLMKAARPFIVSEQNLPLLGHRFSYDDYDHFYQKHFAPLKISTLQLLTEPVKPTYQEPKPSSDEETDREMDKMSSQDSEYYPVKSLILPPNMTDITPQNGSSKPQDKPAQTKGKPEKPQKPAKPKQPTPPAKPVKPLDLDDEYYDLEGF